MIETNTHFNTEVINKCPHTGMNVSRVSAASASLHHHLLIVLQHHPVRLVQVQHGNRTELGGNTAGFGNVGVHRVNQRLYDSVIGGVQVIGQGKRTLAVTVVRLVSRRSHDPVVPAHVAKVHVKRVSPTVAVALSASLLGASLRSPR